MSATTKTFEDIDREFEQLVTKLLTYRPEADVELLRRAYAFASDVHRKQLRQSGEPYIAHPVAATAILAEILADEVALAACLLHDTIEDCQQDEERTIKDQQAKLEVLRKTGKPGQIQQLEREIRAQQGIVERVRDEVSDGLHEVFGDEIFNLVDGITKLSTVRYVERAGGDANSVDEETRLAMQAETMRRMFVASAVDPRVLIIKLADRLHNMQTLGVKRRHKQIKIARESEVIYAKLAERLGIWRIKWEMEDLALRYLEPEAFADIEQKVARTREERLAEIESVSARIQDAAAAVGIEVEVSGRPKHIYSIYHKMLRQGIDFEEIYDLEAIRIICPTVSDCYSMLGVVHRLWLYQRQHLADYISAPKANGYESIHTKVIVPGHGIMEVQIRTREMHEAAEVGAAAHWLYKGSGPVNERFVKHMNELRRFFELARDEDGTGRSAGEFLRELESSLWADEIFVYTPKGDVIGLPKGATVVDFAYRIHSEVGHTCVGAKVGRLNRPLNYVLRTGDTVEIQCAKGTGPSRDWSKFVVTSTARNRIRAWWRRKDRSTLTQTGLDLLAAEAERQGHNYRELMRRDTALPLAQRRRDPSLPVEDVLARVARHRNYNDVDALLTAITERHVSAESVVHQILADLDQAEQQAGIRALPDVIETSPSRQTSNLGRVSLGKVSSVLHRRAGCCQPLPGDNIVGYLTRGSGMALHRADCPNIRYLREREPERVREVTWQDTENLMFEVTLVLRAHDRRGLLRDVSGLLTENDVNIMRSDTLSSSSRAAGDHMAVLRLDLDTINRSQLDSLVRQLPDLGVVKVSLAGQTYYDSEKGGRATTTTVARRPDGGR